MERERGREGRREKERGKGGEGNGRLRGKVGGGDQCKMKGYCRTNRCNNALLWGDVTEHVSHHSNWSRLNPRRACNATPKMQH